MAIQSASPTNLAPAGRPLTEAEIQAFGAEFKAAVMGSSRVQNALKERAHWVQYQAELAQKSIELDKEDKALDKRSSELDQRSKELDQESQALAQRKEDLKQERLAAERAVDQSRAKQAACQQNLQVIDTKKTDLKARMFFGVAHGTKPLPDSPSEVGKISALAKEAISFDASKKSHFKIGPLLRYLDDHPELVITTLSFKHFTGTIKELEKLNARLRNPECKIATIHFHATFIVTAKTELAEAVAARSNKLVIK